MSRPPLRFGHPKISGSDGAQSSTTFDQSASISSAIMSGIALHDPCPISVMVRMVMVPSGAMRTHGDNVEGIGRRAARGMRRMPSVAESDAEGHAGEAGEQARGAKCRGSLRRCVMAQPSLDARSTAAMMRL